MYVQQVLDEQKPFTSQIAHLSRTSDSDLCQPGSTRVELGLLGLTWVFRQPGSTWVYLGRLGPTWVKLEVGRLGSTRVKPLQTG